MTDASDGKDKIINMDNIVYNYVEKNILNGKFNIILNIYPFLKSKILLMDLWKEIFIKHKNIPSKKELILKFIFIAISENYLSSDRDTFKQISKTLEESDSSTNNSKVIKEIRKMILDKEYIIITPSDSPTKFEIIRTFTDVSPVKMANELTKYCSELYLKIKIHDFLEMIIKDCIPENSYVDNLIKISEIMTYIVPWEILSESDPNRQKELVNYFTELAVNLKKLNNYHLLFSVVLGLSFNCLNNIPHLWYNSITYKKYTELNQFISYQKNYNNYRMEICQKNNKNNTIIPCLSIINLDIKHFTEIELFDQKKIKFDKNKVSPICEYVSQFKSFNLNYNIESDKSIKLFIKNLPKDLNDKKIYELYQIYKSLRKGSSIEKPVTTDKRKRMSTKSIKRLSIMK